MCSQYYVARLISYYDILYITSVKIYVPLFVVDQPNDIDLIIIIMTTTTGRVAGVLKPVGREMYFFKSWKDLLAWKQSCWISLVRESGDGTRRH